MLIDINSLPGIVDPSVANSNSSLVSSLDHVMGQNTLLGLVLVLVGHICQFFTIHSFPIPLRKTGGITYVENKDAKLRLGQVLATTHSLTSSLNILLELLDGVFKSGSGIIDLVDNEDALANQVLHLTQGSEVEPLGTGDLFANLLNLGILAERLVQRQADSLNGDIGRAGLLEERSQDTGGDVAAAADGNHQLGLELTQKTVGRLLAQLVDLESASIMVSKFVANQTCLLSYDVAVAQMRSWTMLLQLHLHHCR